MKRELPAYVYCKGYLYLERRGAKTIRLYEKPGTREFAFEYARALSGVPQVPAGKSFKALIASYKRSQRFKEIAPHTHKDYDHKPAFVEDRMGALDPSKMQRKDVIRLRDSNAKAVRFANYLVQVVRILMEHAIDIGWIDQNPAKGYLS